MLAREGGGGEGKCFAIRFSFVVWCDCFFGFPVLYEWLDSEPKTMRSLQGLRMRDLVSRCTS